MFVSCVADNDGDVKTPAGAPLSLPGGGAAGGELQHQLSSGGGPGSVPPHTPGNKLDSMPGSVPTNAPGSVPPPAPPQPGMQAPMPSDGHQFMQQQSQICVFSTNLANKAADMVRAGHYASIRDYHMDSPQTKSYLQVRVHSARQPQLRLTRW